jgi:hypothetical protein
MGNMSRRGFLGRSAAIAASAMLPIPRAMALVTQDTPALRWFAVGNDEYLYPYLSTSMAGAVRQYAMDHGKTVADECPECGGTNCLKHNDDLDAPQPWLEENGFAFDSGLPIDRDPSNAEWIKAGCNVPCEVCDYGDPTQCWVFDGQAHCEDCLHIARMKRLDALAGTFPDTPIQQRRWN